MAFFFSCYAYDNFVPFVFTFCKGIELVLWSTTGAILFDAVIEVNILFVVEMAFDIEKNKQ